MHTPKFAITPSLTDVIASSESAFFFAERVATVFVRALIILDYNGWKKCKEGMNNKEMF